MSPEKMSTEYEKRRIDWAKIRKTSLGSEYRPLADYASALQQIFIHNLKSQKTEDYIQPRISNNVNISNDDLEAAQEISDSESKLISQIFSIMNEIVEDLKHALRIDQKFDIVINPQMDGINTPMLCKKTITMRTDGTTDNHFSIHIGHKYLDVFFLRAPNMTPERLFHLVFTLAEEMFHLRQLIVLDYSTQGYPYHEDPAEQHAKHGALRYLIEKAKVSEEGTFWKQVAESGKIQEQTDLLRSNRESDSK